MQNTLATNMQCAKTTRTPQQHPSNHPQHFCMVQPAPLMFSSVNVQILFFLAHFFTFSFIRLASHLPKFSTVTNYVTMRVFDRGQKRYNQVSLEQALNALSKHCNEFIISRLYKWDQDFCNLCQNVCVSSSPAFLRTPIQNILGLIHDIH